HLHRVVVAVVAALNLDDQVPAGDRAHQVDGIHRGLGAGVAEPPLRQAEPAGQLFGHGDRVLGRLGKVGTAPDLLLHGAHDGRVGVPGQRGTVAAVQVDVGVPVHVVD